VVHQRQEPGLTALGSRGAEDVASAGGGLEGFEQGTVAHVGGGIARHTGSIQIRKSASYIEAEEEELLTLNWKYVAQKPGRSYVRRR
jgi:hypothetical protein